MGLQHLGEPVLVGDLGANLSVAFEELEYGFPRNDRLLTATLDEVRAIRASFGFDDSHLVVLYAPTWRDGQDARTDSDRCCRSWWHRIHLDLDQLAAAVGSMAVLVRTHYSLFEASVRALGSGPECVGLPAGGGT